MGKKEREKGIRAELKIRDAFRNAGFHSWRVPLSGAAEGFKSDVLVCPHHPTADHRNRCPEPLQAEVKCRHKLPTYLDSSRTGLLVLVEDRHEPRAIIPLPMLIEFLRLKKDRS